MKTRGIVHILSTMAGVALSLCGFAQRQGSIGMSIVLKPIQTIQVETRSEKGDSGEKVSAIIDKGYHNQQLTAFGTAAYKITVDQKAGLDPLYQLMQVPPSRERPNLGVKVPGMARIREEKDNQKNRTLFLYSIQVD